MGLGLGLLGYSLAGIRLWCPALTWLSSLTRLFYSLSPVVQVADSSLQRPPWAPCSSDHTFVPRHSLTAFIQTSDLTCLVLGLWTTSPTRVPPAWVAPCVLLAFVLRYACPACHSSSSDFTTFSSLCPWLWLWRRFPSCFSTRLFWFPSHCWRCLLVYPTLLCVGEFSPVSTLRGQRPYLERVEAPLFFFFFFLIEVIVNKGKDKSKIVHSIHSSVTESCPVLCSWGQASWTDRAFGVGSAGSESWLWHVLAIIQCCCEQLPRLYTAQNMWIASPRAVQGPCTMLLWAMLVFIPLKQCSNARFLSGLLWRSRVCKNIL